MGVENHNAILAVTWNPIQSKRIANFISTLPKEQQSLFIIRYSVINGFINIIMIPDGSNDGWETSNKFDELRDEFIKQLEAVKYKDGSNSIKWIEVGFGEYGQKVLRGNNVNCYTKDEYFRGR